MTTVNIQLFALGENRTLDILVRVINQQFYKYSTNNKSKSWHDLLITGNEVSHIAGFQSTRHALHHKY